VDEVMFSYHVASGPELSTALCLEGLYEVTVSMIGLFLVTTALSDG